jgi:hypothetical protein
MNCRITETSLRNVCRELLDRDNNVSHRALREVLRERFGAAGKTARVLAVWREESERAARARFESQQPSQPQLPNDVRELQQRLAEAELIAEQMKTRAQLAELREQSHQDHWAVEVDRLREQLRAQPNYAREVRTLKSTVIRLTAEISALRAGSDQPPQGEGASGFIRLAAEDAHLPPNAR